MKKLLLIVFLAAGWGIGTLYAKDKPAKPDDKPVFADAAALNRWITYYYLKPEPEKTVAAIRLMSTTGKLDDQAALSPIMAFLSEVFRQNPKQLPIWADQLKDIKPEHRRLVWQALRLSGLKKEVDVILKTARKNEKATMEDQFFIDELYMRDPPDLLTVPIRNSGTLDAMWGHFVASGDERFIVRIIETLAGLGKPKDIGAFETATAARLSLTSNAVQHPKVMAVCKKQIETQPEEIKSILKTIVTEAETALKALPPPPPADKPQ
jgi:hypothetical protein